MTVVYEVKETKVEEKKLLNELIACYSLGLSIRKKYFDGVGDAMERDRDIEIEKVVSLRIGRNHEMHFRLNEASLVSQNLN
mmetsp:Transcript_16301/g.45101  ORF Transcript_16301/g.45101 Transcript_16301/m.45101 type:complete len:81 (+) Transcript_16301:856-1098(+)